METHWQGRWSTPATRAGATSLIGTLACASALALGAVHFAVNTWMFIGEGALTAGDLALYLGYVVGVSVLCGIFGVAALGITHKWGERYPRRLLLALTWLGCALISLLAVLTLAQAITTRDIGRLTFAGPGPWSLACGPLLGLAAWRGGRSAIS